MKKEEKEITILNNNSIQLPSFKTIKNNILFIGNFAGICGEIENKNLSTLGVGAANARIFLNLLAKQKPIYFICSQETRKYFCDFLTYFRDKGLFNKGNIFYDKYGLTSDKAISLLKFCELNYSENNRKNKVKECIHPIHLNYLKTMKFDYIIQNPPYNKSLHLDFLKLGIDDLLSEKGKMVIIEPATWLINVRNNNKFGKDVKEFKKYERIKERINGHIESVVIENYNKEFGTGLYVPFATTTIDMSKTYETIDCTICGEHKIVESIYDINLVGKYDTIWSILEKVQKHGDVMNDHITKEDKGRGYWYTKYAEIIGCGGCIMSDDHNGFNFESDAMYSDLSNGRYLWSFVASSYAVKFNDITNEMAKRVIRGNTKGETSDKDAECLYGTKTELENWKYFIFNNKLPLFINIVMTIDQNNNSKEFLPWLVDKQYTDDEINKMFGFTDEEIKLINITIKKYERNSPWFKRYMCGSESVTDEEVNNFIKEISM